MTETVENKPDVLVGACGWLQPHWQSQYYPADLPADWRLGYYANDFRCALAGQRELADATLPLEDWCEEAGEGFRLFLQADALSQEPAALVNDLGDCLAGIICKNSATAISLQAVAGDIPLFVPQATAGLQPLWTPSATQPAAVAMIEDDLTDLRRARALIEPFLAVIPETTSEAAVLVDHADLRAEDLSRFRAMLEMMGY